MAPRAGGDPQQIVVLLHGVGADGHDLIGLAPALAPSLPHALFLAPDAPQPFDMGPFGRQWFSLQNWTPASLSAGVRGTAPTLDAYLDGVLERYALQPDRMALVGFSQGTMMALFVAPRRARPVGAVLGFSGALVDPAALPRELRSRPPAMLVHGELDEVVPVAALDQAAQGLKASGIVVEALTRPGLGHGIDPEGLAAGGRFLQSALLPRST